MNEYISMWKNFANFGGRSSRREYMLAILINFVVVWLLAFACTKMQITALSPVASLYGLAVFVPSLSLHLRRLRDAGKSALWVLLLLVPFVGFVLVVYLMCKESV